jgi:hypothetical protein
VTHGPAQRTAIDSACAPFSSCFGHVETRALHPDTGRLVDVHITITGRFLDQEPIDTQLLSLSTLLRNGWRVALNANVAITAGGYHISLECCDGMWLLPLPARSASALDK